jgi:hypothetical protein
MSGFGFSGGPLDIQAHRMPLIGNYFDNPHEQNLLNQYQYMSQAYNAYRQPYMNAQMQAWRNTSGLGQPMNDLMAAKWGAGSQMPFQQTYYPIMSSYGMGVGAPQSQYGATGMGGSSGLFDFSQGGGFKGFLGRALF